MRNKKERIGLFLLAYGFLLALGLLTATGAAQPAKSGCAQCHDTLVKTVAPDHPALADGELQSCLTCHSSDGAASAFDYVIHLSHYRGNTFKDDCFSCHRNDGDGRLSVIGLPGAKGPVVPSVQMAKMIPYFRSWASSNFLDHRHEQIKKTCLDCHLTYFPVKGVSMGACFKCHSSYGKLATMTEKAKLNPHASHLDNLECALCHKAHRKSELYCNQCHEFDLKVP
jgi:hypothetical protein